MALLMTASMRPPHWAANFAAAAMNSRRTATSSAKACALPPRARMCSATISQSASSRSAMPTVAPQSASVSAMDRPRPRAAPLMNTWRPDRSGWRVIRLPSDLELPGLPVRDDVSRRGLGKMAADDQRWRTVESRHELRARARSLDLVHVEARFTFRYGDLDGVMHHVTGDHRTLAARLDQHADMPGRMSGCRDQRHLISEPEVRVDEFHQPRIQHRHHGVIHVMEVVVAIGLVEMLPVFEFAAAEQVARLREGRYPLAIDQARVPSHMVEMQVRAQHVGDFFVRESGLGQILEKSGLHVGEHRELTLPVVADAGVDHGHAALRAQHETLEGDDNLPLRCREMRLQPAELLHEFRGFIRQQHADIVFPAVDLDDTGDVHVAYLPVPDVFRCHPSPRFSCDRGSGRRHVQPPSPPVHWYCHRRY